ncbi:cholinesterase [Galendromus occidentalis]|uniref:Carboxylic ester hydrolase n=1 Tax=Galendromus occidentalis TaxID=34638 RepID=A0AAJ6QQN6_9ACAR|nr:cholinesterase [Galendromus occidentalis]
MDTAVVLVCFLLGLVSANPVVEGEVGRISGKIDKILDTEIEAFLGIPYAKPPLGELRFAKPQPFGSVGNFQATELPPLCPQLKMCPLGRYSVEEDCLYLNVYRKSGTKKDDKKAVLAIIHGGGYIVGSSADVFQSAEPQAGLGDLIVVSLNYRLGIFGFADMQEIAPGNLGLQDQRLALQWIQRNIAAFGGDPKKVTVMGGSAGSMSIAAQIITIVDREHLFRAAVLDAGVVNSNGFFESSESSFARVRKIAEIVGCPDAPDEILACLRNVPAHYLLANSTETTGLGGITSFVPTTDGVFLPKDIGEFLAQESPSLRKIPMIIGHARDEGTMFVSLADRNFNFTIDHTKDEIVDYCAAIGQKFDFPLNATQSEIREKIGRIYVDENSGNSWKAAAAFAGDGIFACPINSFIKNYSRHSDKVFAYRFDRRLKDTHFKIFDPSLLGAHHFSPYLHFSGALFLDDADGPIDGGDQRFSLDAMNMIASFAKHDENPNFRGVEWPDYSKSGEILIFNETPKRAKGSASEAACDELFHAHQA